MLNNPMYYNEDAEQNFSLERPNFLFMIWKNMSPFKNKISAVIVLNKSCRD